MITFETKCKNCKKKKGEHKAKTLNCPTGSKTRIGYTSYSSTLVFEPVKQRKIENKNIL